MKILTENVFDINGSYTLQSEPAKISLQYNETKDMVGKTFIYKGWVIDSPSIGLFEYLGITYKLSHHLFLDCKRFCYVPYLTRPNYEALYVKSNCKAIGVSSNNSLTLRAGTIITEFEDYGKTDFLITSNHGTKYLIKKYLVTGILDAEYKPVITPGPYPARTIVAIAQPVTQTIQTVTPTNNLEIEEIISYKINGLIFRTKVEAEAAKAAFESMLNSN